MAAKQRIYNPKGGYSKVHLTFNVFLNIFLSLILIIFSIPLFLIISLIIKLLDGGPILYKGVRLGLNKEPFIMYKFRTLIPDAEKKVGAELLTSKHNLVTPVGKYLRDTRLDELPQLFNIFKGDMDFVGPRPERPQIYEEICKHINGYDKRFSIKPGLIGYSQLFTPHSSPKRIRTMIDNRFLKKKQNFMWDISMIVYTILIVTKITFCKAIRYIWNNILKTSIFCVYKEKRTLERTKLEIATVYIGLKNGNREIFTDQAVLGDINEKAFHMYSNYKLNLSNSIFKLQIQYKRWGRKGNKKKAAICYGKVLRERKTKNNHFKYSYVIKYKPISPLNFYIIHQYFLSESII